MSIEKIPDRFVNAKKVFTAIDTNNLTIIESLAENTDKINETVEYVNGIENTILTAKDESVLSAENAKNSEDNAKISEENSEDYKNQSADSANLALSSKDSAENFANSALSSKNSAENSAILAYQYASGTSATIKGVYATVTDLQNNGNHNFVYVVIADGKWYYYDGVWTAGGVYQATTISDNSITESKIVNEAVTRDKLSVTGKNTVELQNSFDKIQSGYIQNSEFNNALNGIAYFSDNIKTENVKIKAIGNESNQLHSLSTQIISTGVNLLNFHGRIAPNHAGSYAQNSSDAKKYLLQNDILPNMTRTGIFRNDGCSITKIMPNSNSIIFNATISNVGIGFKVKVTPNTVYKIQRQQTANYVLGFGFFKSDGTFISDTASSTGNIVTLSTPEFCEILVIVATCGVIGEYTVSNLQLVKGENYPAFTEYKESIVNIPELNVNDKYFNNGVLQKANGDTTYFNLQNLQLYKNGSLRIENVITGNGIYANNKLLILSDEIPFYCIKKLYKLNLLTNEKIDITNNATFTNATDFVHTYFQIVSNNATNGDIIFYELYLEDDETIKPTIIFNYSYDNEINSSFIVTVGENGDFPTLNSALAYISKKFPIYKTKGIEVSILIKTNTIITEQIFIEHMDLSHISITSEDNFVYVDHRTFTGQTHDSRGDKPFFSAENGGKLPVIKTLFVCQYKNNLTNGYAVGYFCNRGSTGVIYSPTATSNGSYNFIYTANGSIVDYTVEWSNQEEKAIYGFSGFNDNIIANNNSEIVLRGANASYAARHGVLSRHISRVSARSAYFGGCGLDYATDGFAVHANRSSMLDVRKAIFDNSFNAIWSAHGSTINANEAILKNLTGNVLINSSELSNIDCHEIIINGTQNNIYIFKVLNGSNLLAKGASISNTGTENTIYNQTPNTITENGIIYN